MKSLLICFSFILFSAAITAQESIENPIATTQTEKNISDNSTSTIVTPLSNVEITPQIEDDKVCYGEISKITYYEALISQNEFDIDLKDSADIVIKNTEDIISNKRDQVLYSEED
ncbi:hypothetical protein AB832_04910 [Flavobacteriaceae bacterium (ex Bugula neritina AB1)]|nr:hypothetical protein AB832_04910 [Flavobacteriaceae bacterium (ex Bugula neritina AB1)]